MTESEWWAATDPLSPTNWLFFDAFATDRKLRFFSVACCRRVVPLLRHLSSGAARILPLTEAFADLSAPPEVLREACDVILHEFRGFNDVLFHRFRDRIGELSAETMTPDELDAVAFFWVATCAAKAAVMVARFADERDRLDCRYRSREFYQNQGPDQRIFPFAVAAEAAEAVHHVEPESAPESRQREQTYQVHFLHDIFGPLPFRDLAVAPAWLTSDVLLLARGIYDDKAFDRMPILADALQDAGCDNDDVLNHCRAEGWEHVRGCWVIDLLLGRPWRESGSHSQK